MMADSPVRGLMRPSAPMLLMSNHTIPAASRMMSCEFAGGASGVSDSTKFVACPVRQSYLTTVRVMLNMSAIHTFPSASSVAFIAWCLDSSMKSTGPSAQSVLPSLKNGNPKPGSGASYSRAIISVESPVGRRGVNVMGDGPGPRTFASHAASSSRKWTMIAFGWRRAAAAGVPYRYGCIRLITSMMFRQPASSNRLISVKFCG